MHATSVRQTRKQNPLMTDGDRTKCGVTERATDPEEYEKKLSWLLHHNSFAEPCLGAITALTLNTVRTIFCDATMDKKLRMQWANGQQYNHVILVVQTNRPLPINCGTQRS